MSTRQHKIACDEVLSKDPSLKLIRGGLLPDTYKTTFGALDFADDDIPNWRAVKAMANNYSVRLNYPAGTPLPISIPNFQDTYAQAGSRPRFITRKMAGGGWLTANITTANTTAANGTYVGQAMVDDTGIHSANGIGSGGTVTVIVFGGVATSVAKVAGGLYYEIGDTFTVAAIPGAVFTISSTDVPYFQDLTASAIVLVGEVAGLPDSLSVEVDDDGTGHLQDNIQLIISN